MLPKEDLVQDIRVLEEDIETLSNKSVLLNGISPENSIFNGELYLVDPTEYRVLEDPCFMDLLMLFISLRMDSLLCF